MSWKAPRDGPSDDERAAHGDCRWRDRDSRKRLFRSARRMAERAPMMIKRAEAEKLAATDIRRADRAADAADLQALVERHGGYDQITPEAWGAFDRAVAEWQELQRGRAEGSSSNRRVIDPEALCICGEPGVVSCEREGGGRPIWRCEQHRNLWPDYAEKFRPAEDEW